MIVYNAFVIPYNIGFIPISSDDVSGWDFDRAVDLFFGIDIMLNFITGYQQSASTGGAVVMAPKQIVWNYLTLVFCLVILTLSLKEWLNAAGSLRSTCSFTNM